MGAGLNLEIHRGDLWWATIPGDKRRPVLVLTRERFIPRLTSLLVAPVTTAVRRIPTEVTLGAEDGLPSRSAARFDNLLTLHRARFESFISRLPDERLDEVCLAYRFAAGC
jgi:mRNA interferase MazF